MTRHTNRPGAPGESLSPADEGFVARARARSASDAAIAAGSARGEQLAARVLLATTRRRTAGRVAVPSLFDVFRERWRESRLVRVAAASLLVHVAALPILGWYAFRDPEPRVHIGFELPGQREDAFGRTPDAPPELDVPEVASLLDEASGARPNADEVENARRRARFRLHTTDLPPSVEAGSVQGRVLAARSRGVADGDWSAIPQADEVRDDGVARALLAETLLDRAVLTGESSGLREVLELLRPDAIADASAAIEREAARRALALGFADDDLCAGWRADRWYEGRRDRWADPLTGRWLDLLERATIPSERDAVVDAWLSWQAR